METPNRPVNGELAEMIRSHFERGYRGHCIDVGASDGVYVNTTYLLEKAYGWTVLSVEPNPSCAHSLRRYRDFIELCACSDKPSESIMWINDDNPESFSSLRPTTRRDLEGAKDIRWSKIKVRVDTVDNLLNKWEFPKLDVLCIDTEGTEKDVLEGANLSKWNPKVIVSESWDEDGGEVRKYLEERGYERIRRNIHNDIYLKVEGDNGVF